MHSKHEVIVCQPEQGDDPQAKAHGLFPRTYRQTLVYRIFLVIRLSFVLPKQSQRSRSIL